MFVEVRGGESLPAGAGRADTATTPADPAVMSPVAAAMSPAATTVRGPVAPVTAGEVAVLVARLGVTRAGLSDAERVELIGGLEELTAAAAGTQAVLTSDLDVSTRAGEAAAGVPARRRGAGVAAQVGLARREGHHRAVQHVALARTLTAVLPYTLAGLRAGRLSEWRASIIARETMFLTAVQRQGVDESLCADPVTITGWGDRRLAEETRRLAYAAAPEAAVARARHAETERYVSARPAPDTMMWLTALLPVVDGVAAYAALHRVAEAARCDGDSRSRGQVMSDTLVQRLTGRPATWTPAAVNATSTASGAASGPDAPTDAATGAAGPDADADADGADDAAATSNDAAAGGGVDLVVNVVMTDRTLLAGGDEPAVLDGYGVVPAGWARDLISNALNAYGDTVDGLDEQIRVFVRRLYTAPGSGALVGMDSRRRHPPPGLAAVIRLRDRATCRIPYCDAPARHADHLIRHTDGGPTSDVGLAGLCAAHNYAKEAPGHVATPEQPPPGRRRRRHTFTLTTPTGHTYTSTAPPPPGTPA